MTRAAQAAFRAVVKAPGAVSLAVLGAGALLGLADAAVACARELSAAATTPGLGHWLTTLALGLAVGTLAALPAALAMWPLVLGLRWRPRFATGLGLSLLALVLWVMARRFDAERIEWRALDPWLPTSLLLLATALLSALGALVRRSGRLRRRLSALLVLLCALSLGIFGVATAEARAFALAAADGGSVWLSPLLQRASRALDADGDLHPRWLCGEGCDCDDSDGDIHPMAREIAGNGIDEDCDGRDGPVAETTALDRPEAEHAAADGPDAGTDAGPEVNSEIKRPPDVLLIVIDTLRLDHLGLYGYGLPTSPRIDALGARSVVFEQARSTGPSTRFSMPAMLTSKWFTELERNDYEWPAISMREVLLGERLKELGYTLAAFHSIRYFRPYFHLGQGFDHWSDAALDARKPELRMISSDFITDEVLTWLDGWLGEQARDGGAAERPPLFLWAYYGDPHAVYMHHEAPFRFGHGPVARYDGEIAFTDHHLGRLLDGLAERGLDEELIVVLTSDHGEALDREQDHGSLNHSKSLYDELIRVPLLVKGPDFEPQRIATPVSLLDLLPTFVALAGAPLPPELRGVSLLPWLERSASAETPEPPHPPLFFEKHRAIDDPQKGMLAWPHKVITTVPTGRMQIFDLEQDPRERRDIRMQLPDKERARLEGMLKHWASSVLVPAKHDYRH